MSGAWLELAALAVIVALPSMVAVVGWGLFWEWRHRRRDRRAGPLLTHPLRRATEDDAHWVVCDCRVWRGPVHLFPILHGGYAHTRELCQPAREAITR